MWQAIVRLLEGGGAMSCRRIWLAVWVVWVAGCSGDGRVREEARAFLAVYESTDHRAPFEEREQKLRQLRALVVSNEEVRRTRDQCVQAHQTLIDAEKAHERAARSLDRAIAETGPGEPLAQGDTLSIKAEIERANRALADARERFSLCEDGARALSLRFGTR